MTAECHQPAVTISSARALTVLLDPRVRDQVIAITPERVVFDGHLGAVKQHRHAVVALLVGVERPFRLTTAAGSVSCAALLKIWRGSTSKTIGDWAFRQAVREALLRSL